MKRATLIFMLLFIISHLSFTQTHAIKTNLLGWAYKSINIGYEFKIGPRVSVGLNSEYRVPGSLNIYLLADRIGTDEISYSGDIKLDGIGVTPHFRYYTRNALKGFYLQPFFRYLNYSFELPYAYEDDGEVKNGATYATLKGYGGGLSLGVQATIGEHFILDFNFGMGVVSGDVHATASYPTLEESDYEYARDAIYDLKEEGSSIPFIGNLLEKVEAGSDATSAWIDISRGIFPSIKGGISIGYTF